MQKAANWNAAIISFTIFILTCCTPSWSGINFSGQEEEVEEDNQHSDI